MDALGENLKAAVAAAAEGRTSLEELFEWLAAHVQEIADCHDEALVTLSDRAWIVLSEVDKGDRDEDSARAELRASLRPRGRARAPQRQSA